MGSYTNFLKRNKAYTAIDVLGLALSMMLVALIGGYVWQEMHVNTQYTKLDRIFMIGYERDSGGLETGTNWRVQSPMRGEFPEVLSTVSLRYANLTLLNTESEEVSVEAVLTDTTFTDFFEAELKEGDWRTAIADRNSVVVTEDFAQKAFGTTDAMGMTLMLNDSIPLHVAGIMEPIINSSITSSRRTPIDMIGRFELMEFIDWWAFSPEMNQIGGTEVLMLAPEGVDLTENRDKYDKFMNTIALPGGGKFNQFGGDWGMKLEILPFKDFYLSNWGCSNLTRADGDKIKIMLVAGIMILLFALMNYVNLTVALSSGRAKEMATRRLLGDSRKGIMMRLIGEATALCFVSMCIGVALAFFMAPYASKLIGAQINLVSCVTPVTVAALIAITIVMGVLAGIIPAVLISSSKPIDVVRGTFRRHSKMIFSKVFIVAQNLITIVMVAATLTVYVQFRHLVNAPLGYDYKHVMVMQAPNDKAQVNAITSEISKLPAVEAMSWASSPILYGGHNNTQMIDGQNIPFQLFMVDTCYFAVNGFRPEIETGITDGVYVNHALLEAENLGIDALEFKYGYPPVQKIRGVIPDMKMGSVLNGTLPMILMIGEPSRDYWYGNSYFLIRVNGDETETYKQVQQIFLDVTGKMPYVSTPYQDQIIESSFSSMSTMSKMLAVFSLVALMISVLGLVAMSTFFVQQRSMEIAVRKVHGASKSSVIARIVTPFMIYVLIAFVLAVPVIYKLMNEWLADYSYRIDLYWWIYVVAGLVCAIVSFVSVLWQTSKAASANPVKSLAQNR